MNQVMQELLALLGDCVSFVGSEVKITQMGRLRQNIHRLAEVSALESGPRQGMARYLMRLIALEAGVIPASINDLLFGAWAG